MSYKPAVRSLLQRVATGPVMGRQAENLQALSAVRNLHVSEPLTEIFMINSEDDFKNKVMRNTLPVIVNFHAEWCEPCHSLKPLLEKIAQENEGHLHLAEVAVDEHVDLLQAFEVTAVPAVLGIHRGMVVEKFVGLVSHKEVKGFVEKLLNK
ncbi:thioredoxin, mitochondrial-like [Eriocheir sinensis]|uniref:thioredoxin, mitochondrial-like n=1 Tax=Eriocheir sinensis TaxID=95602 RepID=UPI0021C6E546|nr:thioredoxin, mitochondrial-like [Eriocheir sinensis]